MASTVYVGDIVEKSGDQAVTMTTTSGTAVTAMTLAISDGGKLTVTCTT
jgi:hypothetical protein